jgi:hypothetical protein
MYHTVDDNAWFNVQESSQNSQSVKYHTDPYGEDQPCLDKAVDMVHDSMCEKLAVISVDLLKNQTMTRIMLAQTQQGDDYLGVIRERVIGKDNSYPIPNFFIKDMVLCKKCRSRQSNDTRYAICLPDVLLPAVIHVDMGHSSYTVTRRNFEHYNYNRNAARAIKSYVQACVTCGLANKFEIHKATTETRRSLEPNRPRQYLCCDILPMAMGTMPHL